MSTRLRHLFKGFSFATFFALLAVIGLAILTNTIRQQGFAIPAWTDELLYNGYARKIVLFGTDELRFLPWEAYFSNLFAALLGGIGWLLNVDVAYVSRVVQLLAIALTILGYYRLGARTSRTFGLFLAFLVSTFHAPSFAYAFQGFFPSLIATVALPYAILALQEKHWKTLAAWGLVVGLLHWWSLAPLFVFTVAYVVIRRQQWHLLGLALGAAFLFHLSPFFDKLPLISPFSRYDATFLSLVWQWLWPLLGLSALGLCLHLRRRQSFFTPTTATAVALFMPSVLLLLATGLTYSVTRTFPFALMGLFLFSAVFFEELQKILQREWVALTFLVAFSAFSFRALFLNTHEVFYNTLILPSEYEAFEWLESQSTPFLLVSDFYTMYYYSGFLPAPNTADLEHLFYLISFQPQNPDAIAEYGASIFPTLDFLARETFSETDFAWLSQLKTQYNVNNIYVVFQPRTRQNLILFMQHWNLEQTVDSGSAQINPHSFGFTVAGEAKFSTSASFQVPYHNDDVTIYQYIQ